jgi:hypothetical protein
MSQRFRKRLTKFMKIQELKPTKINKSKSYFKNKLAKKECFNQKILKECINNRKKLKP